MNLTPIPPSALPRKDLREDAFRKYEVPISHGLVKEHIVNPYPLKPDTYIARFNDAKLAFKRFGYRSEHIKPFTDLSTIKAFAMTDGTICIKNMAVLQNTPPPELLTIEEQCKPSPWMTPLEQEIARKQGRPVMPTKEEYDRALRH